MPRRLPLFPLGTVLFPGGVLPLRIFEERYRALVGELLDRPEPDRELGVIAIRSGREVGADGVLALYPVGCVARVARASRHSDGQYDLVTVGTTRFRLTGLRTDRPYLIGEVELLAENAAVEAVDGALASAVRDSFEDYLQALHAAGARTGTGPLPADISGLGYAVAAQIVCDLEARQELLAAADGRSRLRLERSLLRHEARLLRSLRAVPAAELARTPVCAN